jgi:hypothetical protein
VVQRDARVLGDRDELLDRVETLLVAQVVEPELRPVGAVVLALAVPAGEQASGERRRASWTSRWRAPCRS